MSATPTSRRTPALRPSGTDPDQVRAGRGAQRSAQRTYTLMLLPALLLLIGIMIPFADGVWTSLTDEKSYTGTPNFIGLGNYIEVLKDTERFWPAVGRTALFTGVVLFFEIVLVLVVVVISWFALYTLYRLITDES